jgi:protein-disulfide isomerase
MRLISAVIALLLLTPTAQAEEKEVFSPEQKAAIEAIIKEVVAKNPTMITNALEAAQIEMQEKMMAEQKEKLRANKARIEDASSGTVGGNPKGDVTIVEFFDYKCGYCRTVHPTMKQLIEDDKNVRIIYKEFPILGQISTQAARYALAARNQGKYVEMRDALFDPDTQLDLNALPEIAKSLGLDMDRVSKDIASKEIAAEIRDNIELAQELNIRGTPAFIIGDRLLPGAGGLNDMKQLVAEARGKPADAAAKP